jgi:tRNA uridine 5-carboxymethylaminomethyl modification enzyme
VILRRSCFGCEAWRPLRRGVQAAAPLGGFELTGKSIYEVIVIGGGHAGAEAAWAAARLGCATALVTMKLEAVGRMSCNPAIGGLAKGQMVREIDALGGLMALATDRAGIQFRMLNRSKGPAVWAPRAQADRDLYAITVQDLLRNTDGLDLIEGTVDRLIVESQEPRPGTAAAKIAGVVLADGSELRARSVVLTTGTFMGGLLHCGADQTRGGRVGESAAVTLSDELRRLGFELGRLKTGTPPRVHRDSIDYTQCSAQPGDDPPVPFSFLTHAISQRQVDCWITHTNETTHALIRDNIHRAPMYSGQIKSRGPRYCPSIEDKIMRFADKTSHQLFLEPEGYESEWIYCNGIPTSLPKDVQEPLVRSIPGLQNARILQWGYAVEYDWVPTDQTRATLETKRIEGLFLAGQTNGTSGYEEAAGQGLVAGINAVARLRGTEPLVLGRDEAYIGVMIDDLVTRPPDEPYRMFSSRAEYRLMLRGDNADMRLTPIGRRIGLVDDHRWEVFEHKQAAMGQVQRSLAELRLEGRSLAEWLRRPEILLADLPARHAEFDLTGVAAEVLEAVEINLKYSGYLEREQRLIDRHRQLEARLIPEDFDFQTVNSLRFEAKERFSRFRPRSVGQAARISGISPADIATLALYLRR